MIPGISGGQGGIAFDGGQQASDSGGELSKTGHVFQFGARPTTGTQGLDFNRLALYGVGALALLYALKRAGR